MYFFRAAIFIAVIAAGCPAAWADSPITKVFEPFIPSYKNSSGGESTHMPTALPHFFPLPPRRPAALPIAINRAAKSPGDDMPVPPGGTPEAMTQEQAKQILSLFGSDE